jgi:outer membrane protein assembly factor BamB
MTVTHGHSVQLAIMAVVLGMVAGCGGATPETPSPSLAPPQVVDAEKTAAAAPADDCCTPEAALDLTAQPSSAPGTVSLAQATFGGSVGRNMVNLVDKNVPTSWSVEEGKFKNIKWVAAVGTRSYGGPVVHGGRVFVGTNNDKPRDPKIKGQRAVLMCFAEKDGAFLWQNVYKMDEDVVDAAIAEGLCSTPTVEGEFVYYVTPMCDVICAQAKDGKEVWSYDLMKELKVFPCYLSLCSPLVVGDFVYVMTANGTTAEGKLVSPDAPSFVALTKKDGKLVWQNNLPGANVIEGQWSNPAYAEVNGKPQIIFAAGDGCVYGLEPRDGKMIWKFQGSYKNPEGKRAGTQPYFVSTPAVVGNRVYVGTGSGPEAGPSPKFANFFCLDITKKGDVSCKDGQFNLGDPANKGSALVWQLGGPIVPPPAKGRQVRFGPTLSTAAVHDGLVYIAEEAGFLRCFDAKTGQEYWSHDPKAAVWGSPYWVDGRVYLCTQGTECLIFPHGKTYAKPRVIDMEEVMESTPLVVNGVLYITTKTKIYAIQAGK